MEKENIIEITDVVKCDYCGEILKKEESTYWNYTKLFSCKDCFREAWKKEIEKISALPRPGVKHDCADLMLNICTSTGLKRKDSFYTQDGIEVEAEYKGLNYKLTISPK